MLDYLVYELERDLRRHDLLLVIDPAFRSSLADVTLLIIPVGHSFVVLYLVGLTLLPVEHLLLLVLLILLILLVAG